MVGTLLRRFMPHPGDWTELRERRRRRRPADVRVVRVRGARALVRAAEDARWPVVTDVRAAVALERVVAAAAEVPGRGAVVAGSGGEAPVVARVPDVEDVRADDRRADESGRGEDVVDADDG